MAGFANIQGRADIAEAQMPDQVIPEIIQEAAKSSVILNRARRIPMSKKKAKQPVLASLPDAYWVNGDTGLKQTTKMGWKDTYITAEELAAIVPIPDALIDDADVPLWDQVKPLLAEAIGLAIDRAAMMGISKPDTWPTAIIPGAIAAGNVVAEGFGVDLGVDVAELGRKVALDGFGINGFASEPGLNWRLVGLRNEQGNPIYAPSMAEGQPSTLYGYPLNEVTNGSWDPAVATLLGADWSKFVVGVRQDITYDLFKEGVISDADGKVVLNLMQQDTKALRVVMRVGFQVQNPLTRLNKVDATRYPAGVLVPV